MAQRQPPPGFAGEGGGVSQQGLGLGGFGQLSAAPAQQAFRLAPGAVNGGPGARRACHAPRRDGRGPGLSRRLPRRCRLTLLPVTTTLQQLRRHSRGRRPCRLARRVATCRPGLCLAMGCPGVGPGGARYLHIPQLPTPCHTRRRWDAPCPVAIPGRSNTQVRRALLLPYLLTRRGADTAPPTVSPAPRRTCPGPRRRVWSTRREVPRGWPWPHRAAAAAARCVSAEPVAELRLTR